MTYWRSMIQLKHESALEGRTELVLNGVKESRGNWFLLFLQSTPALFLVWVIVTALAYLLYD
jgi:hypothetical protein